MNWVLHGLHFTSAAGMKYHGLSNQGATCYLNSVLQVLFMTKDFREAVERCVNNLNNTECIDHPLKDVFDELLRQTANTKTITEQLGIHKVYEQRDAAEYLEKILSLTSSEASQIFHGELTHQVKCSHCLEDTNTDVKFWNLALELVDSHGELYSVVDGIEEYFRVSHIGGENQMYCDKCDSKSDATIKCAVKHHPDVLMLLLKRFEFDYSSVSYVKNNRVVVIPSSLQIPQSQTYELYACVEHFGDLRGGHYTATIKSQDDGRWYNFDDASVTLLYHQPFQKDNIERSQSVYLLFYRKKKLMGSERVDLICNGGDQDNGAGVRQRKPLNDQECNEESSHPCCCLADKKQEVDEEEEGGKAEAEDQAEKIRGLMSVEAQLDERAEGQNYGDAEIHDVRQGRADLYQDLKPGSRDRDATHDRLNEKKEVREVEGRISNIKMHRDGGSGGLENNKFLDSHAGSQDKEESHDVTQTLRGSRSFERCEQQKDDRRDNKGDKEQRRRSDEAAQGSTTKPYCGEGVEDRDGGESDDGGQNGPEETVGVTHTTQEAVGAEEQQEENKDSSRSGTEKLRENQGGEGVEKMVNSQPEERAGCEEAAAEGGGGSDETGLQGKVIDIRETMSDVQVRVVRTFLITTDKNAKKTKIHYD